jgi:hypothetical protein
MVAAVVKQFIHNQPPVAILQPETRDLERGEQINFSTAGTYDPDGDAIERIDWHVNYDPILKTEAYSCEPNAERLKRMLFCTFHAGRQHFIEATVFDNRGLRAKSSATVFVAKSATIVSMSLGGKSADAANLRTALYHAIDWRTVSRKTGSRPFVADPAQDKLIVV